MVITTTIRTHIGRRFTLAATLGGDMAVVTMAADGPMEDTLVAASAVGGTLAVDSLEADMGEEATVETPSKLKGGAHEILSFCFAVDVDALPPCRVRYEAAD
jgi:hypothetical protein